MWWREEKGKITTITYQSFSTYKEDPQKPRMTGYTCKSDNTSHITSKLLPMQESD